MRAATTRTCGSLEAELHVIVTAYGLHKLVFRQVARTDHVIASRCYLMVEQKTGLVHNKMPRKAGKVILDIPRKLVHSDEQKTAWMRIRIQPKVGNHYS